MVLYKYVPTIVLIINFKLVCTSGMYITWLTKKQCTGPYKLGKFTLLSYYLEGKTDFLYIYKLPGLGLVLHLMVPLHNVNKV